MPDPLATGQRRKLTISGGDLRRCPVCAEPVAAVEVDAVISGVDVEGSAMAGSVRFEADAVTLLPCQHSYDTATGMWRRR
jgi:hypothetical protein